MAEVIDTYALSPMQQGMLFHAISGHGGEGVDIEQIAIALREPLDLAAFENAWRALIGRHAILRSRFRWSDVASPVQEVLEGCELPLATADWSDLVRDVAESRFAAFRAADRGRDFDLSVAPAMRVFVVRFASDEWHVLWTFHHALLDGRAFAILLRELFALYDASRTGTPAELAAPRPYRDYIDWRDALDFASARAFWQDALRGFHAPTPVAIDGSGLGDDAGGEMPFGAEQRRLPATSTERVRDAARNANVTVNTLLQAAWAIVLHRYSGESDVVFGATRAGRAGFAGAEAMVGLFINTLPMRVQVERDMPVAAWLDSLRTQQVSLRPHEHVPLSSVQGWSAVARGKPLFESVVVYDHRSLDGRLRDEGWASRRFEYTGQTNFPLALIAYGDDEMLLRLEYSRRRFSDASAARLLDHAVTLLESLADAGAGARVGDLEMLTPAERARSAETSKNFAPLAHATLHEAFEAQAARTPDAIALTCSIDGTRVELTYAELDRRASALAQHLRARGVVPSELVGLRTERNADLVIALLAIVKAGGAYLPLDPVYPTERIAFMLEDAGVRFVLTQSSRIGELASMPVACIAVDAPLPAIENPAPPAPPATANDLAYVIYTSGSTGKPKGVRISHFNVLRLFAATDAWFGFGPDDVWTLFHSYAFDFSVWELWGALLYGGRVVVVPQETSRDPIAFRELLLEERVTVLNQTPTAFRQLIDVDRASAPAAFALRYVVFGGEALELQSLRPWMDRHGEERPRLINMYGITETTVHVTYRPIARADIDAGAGSVIGVPIPDLRVYVLDVDGRPAPAAVPGEMYVAGAGVAAGYLNRPELTAQRFVPDPFAPQTEGAAPRMYRSGDLARRLESGELEYLGRIDQQVKIRGFRIELGEIEAVIAHNPRVRQIAVIDREDVPGDKRLVAYLVAETAQEPLLAELRDALRQRLPDYMTPAHFIFVDALPLTPNGKLDRKALPAPDQARAASTKAYVAPRNATEAALADAWKDVLRVERVGIDDHFFELGGDSILSIQVIARCHQRGLRVTPRDLFKHPTIAELAKIVTAATPVRAVEDTATGAVALTPIQKWFFEQRFDEAHWWNQAFLFAVAPDFDVDAFDQALRAVVAHHDALRLRFSEHDGAWTQQYGEMPELRAERVDFSQVSTAARADAITAHATRVQGALDLANGPLIRATCFALGRDVPGRVLLVVHHLVVDGVSWRLLREDLETAYLAAKARKTPTLPPKTTSMRTWSERSDAFAATADVEHALPHWLAVAKTPPTVLPSDAVADGTGIRRLTVALGEDETRAVLQALPKAFRTRINDVLLGSLARALQRVAASETFRIDLEGHGREHIADDVDVSRTIGWFTTLFPVALDVPSSGDAAEAALAVRDRLREVPHRGMSYGLLRYAGRDDAARSALASGAPSAVLFNYLGQFDAVVADSDVFAFADESTGPWRSPRAHRTHAIEIVALVRGGRLEIEWNYDAALHGEATIARAAEAMCAALREMLAAAASGAVRFTAADFPLVRLGADALQRLAARYPNAENVLPLTPMQRLFFAMEASAAGLEQWQFRIDGAIDARALRRAFEWAVARHAILRTAFVDDGGDAPLQIVVRDAALPWREEDWRDADDVARSARIGALLREDAATPFDLAKPPAMRVALIRTAPDAWHLVWTTHHLCIDGWSWPVVFGDIARAYAAYAHGAEPAIEAAIPFGDYVEWLASAPASDDFWRERLAGMTAPTPIRVRAPSGASGHATFAETALTLDRETTASLRQLARRHQVTPAVAMNAAWALVLAHRADASDVAFGASFSGRPPEIRGIESMAGPCVNNLPVRIAVPAQGSIATWLGELQQAQVDLAQHQYTALADIQRCSAVPPRLRLFDSLVVFQNYQIDADALRLGDRAALVPLAAPEATSYPLTITATLGDELRVRLIHQPSMLAVDDVRELAADLRIALEGMARGAEDLAALAALLPSGTRGVAKAAAVANATARREGYVAPTNDVERVIADVWQSLFDVERVSLDDNFFELGGHSLLLVRAHAALKDRLRIDLPIVALLQYPTARGLARHIAGDRTATAANADAAIDRARKQREALARQRQLSGKR